MKKFLLTLLILPLLAMADEEPVMMYGEPEVSPRTQRMARQYEDDLKNGRLAKRTDAALDALIRLSAYKLKRIGKVTEANKLLKEWEDQWSGEIVRLSMVKRGIGDHKPLSEWLAQKYAMLEFLLGKPACQALRITDIHVINFAIPVVISCVDNVSQDEYYAHFVEDILGGYKGLGPVVSYWVSFFSCVGMSWGTGFLWCSPISQGVEYLSMRLVCPKLNEPLWKLSCNG
jgi:hypothetical protein